VPLGDGLVPLLPARKVGLVPPLVPREAVHGAQHAEARVLLLEVDARAVGGQGHGREEVGAAGGVLGAERLVVEGLVPGLWRRRLFLCGGGWLPRGRVLDVVQCAVEAGVDGVVGEDAVAAAEEEDCRRRERQSVDAHSERRWWISVLALFFPVRSDRRP
jgi:hypothetical protein